MKTAKRSHARRQAGFMLIETLVAILIFSVGVLALVGLQATSVRLSSGAKYRSDAALLANQLLGRMWATDRIATNLQADFNTGNPQYTAWAAAVTAALPTAAASSPSVVVANDGQVTIDIFWKAPNEDPTEPTHRYTTLARIR